MAWIIYRYHSRRPAGQNRSREEEKYKNGSLKKTPVFPNHKRFYTPFPSQLSSLDTNSTDFPAASSPYYRPASYRRKRAAARPSRLREPEVLRTTPALVPVAPVVPPVEVPVVLVLPVVPAAAEPGTMMVSVLASSLKFARDRVELAAVLSKLSVTSIPTLTIARTSSTHFSLMTMTIPAWQCLPWAQYTHMGVVLLTMMV